MAIPNEDPDTFQTLINALSVHILVLSTDGAITYINPSCQRHFQQICDDLRGANISALMSPADAVSFKEHLKSLTPENPVGKFEHLFVETNGTIRTQQWTVTAVFDQSPQPTGYHCEGQDISHQKQMVKTMSQWENQLKMQQAMEGSDKSAILSKICQAMQDALIIIDHSGNIKFWGGGAEQILGYSESEIIGKDLHAVLAPQRYHAAAYEAFEKYRHSGLGQILNKAVETEALRKDGTEIPMELFLSPLKIDDQWCALGLMRDISFRKQSEQDSERNLNELQAGKNLLQRIINLLPVRVFWKDKDLRYMGCNDLFARDAGMPNAEAMIGKDDFEMGWREQAALYRADDWEVLNNKKEKVNFEEPQTTPDGEAMYLMTSKVLLTGEDGEVLGILGMYDDITERKLNEMKIASMLHDLEQFQELAIDRENRMIELKKEINVLCREMGRPEPYELAYLDGEPDA